MVGSVELVFGSFYVPRSTMAHPTRTTRTTSLPRLVLIAKILQIIFNKKRILNSYGEVVVAGVVVA